MVFRCQDYVMFGDTDASGIGHFAAQVRFLERAEFYFMDAIGIPPDHPVFRTVRLPRAHLEVDYTAPVRFGDRLEMTVQVVRIGRTSYTLGIDVFVAPSAVQAMRTRLVIVAVDPATGRPTPLPDVLVERLSPYLVPARDDTPIPRPS
ncbi:MAG: acyl-CoA thioesterase [Actinomycetia bacterium]|nr:acyl-CoA thioesterase [Actinomycetes bacterium]